MLMKYIELCAKIFGGWAHYRFIFLLQWQQKHAHEYKLEKLFFFNDVAKTSSNGLKILRNIEIWEYFLHFKDYFHVIHIFHNKLQARN